MDSENTYNTSPKKETIDNQHFTLARTQQTDNIAKLLFRKPLNLQEVTDEFALSENYAAVPNNDIIAVRGAFLEFYIRRLFEVLSQEMLQLDLNPIQAGNTPETSPITPNGDYYFLRSPSGSVEAHAANDTDTYKLYERVAEYDHVVTVENFPLAIEAKCVPPYSETEGTPREVKKAMSENYVKRLLTPIADYFGTDQVGYIIAVPRGTKRIGSNERDSQDSFENRGGRIAEIPYSLQELTAACQPLVKLRQE